VAGSTERVLAANRASAQRAEPVADWQMTGSRAAACRASFNARTRLAGARIKAASAAMNLDPLQQARGACRKLLVGFLDD
jgi:hypothetical protein